MFKLELYLEARLLREYFFEEKGEITIGRRPTHDIHIEYMGVSGDHARISLAPSVALEDLGSKNGTTLNEQPIGGPVPLKHGDVIGITKYRLRFQDEELRRAEELANEDQEGESTWAIHPLRDGDQEFEGGEGDEESLEMKLTPREFECLFWLSRGKTALEIADLLKITKRTVAFHTDNICIKLGASNRTQAITFAIAQNLIDP
ncbi:MAG: FHA domain-containing protein [Sulfuricella sp.]|nr:FHA domain-containing protein [Sulfuricella sp.]